MKTTRAPGLAGRLPGQAIVDNLIVRVSAVAGRHSCEKGT
jgi:hypothetical protein